MVRLILPTLIIVLVLSANNDICGQRPDDCAAHRCACMQNPDGIDYGCCGQCYEQADGTCDGIKVDQYDYTCGGIAGLTCATGYECIYDTSVCDPTKPCEQGNYYLLQYINDSMKPSFNNKIKCTSTQSILARKPDNINAFEHIDDLDISKLITLCLDIYNIKMEDINALNYNQNFIFMNNEFKNYNFKRLLLLQKILDKDHFEYNQNLIMNAYKQFESLYSHKTDELSTCKPIYPYKHRINMFMDRRHSNYENLSQHILPVPLGSNILPFGNKSNNNNKIVHESFLNLTQKCLIPKIGYKDVINEAMYTMNMELKKRIRNSTISCRTAPIIIPQDIKHILPQDIKHILPHIFNMEYNCFLSMTLKYWNRTTNMRST